MAPCSSSSTLCVNGGSMLTVLWLRNFTHSMKKWQQRERLTHQLVVTMKEELEVNREEGRGVKVEVVLELAVDVVVLQDPMDRLQFLEDHMSPPEDLKEEVLEATKELELAQDMLHLQEVMMPEEETPGIQKSRRLSIEH